MPESDYTDVLNKLFIYTVRFVIYAKSLSGCGMHISSIELPNLDKNRKNTLWRLYNTWKKITLSYKITNSDLETVNYYDNYTFLQKYSAELGSLVSDFQVKGSCEQGARKMVLKFSQIIITF